MTKRSLGVLCAMLIGLFSYVQAQDSLATSQWTPEKWQTPSFSWSWQGDALLTPYHNEEGKFQIRPASHSYLKAQLRNNYLDLGVRLEEISLPLPGRDEEKGRGIPFLYLTARYNTKAEFTVGDFYEQFGSGTILRSYEDRTLGIDNSIRGAKLVLSPIAGVRLKSLWGQTRNHFDRNLFTFNSERGTVWGNDIELSSDGLFPQLARQGWNITWGGSWVVKQEKEEPILVERDHKTYRLHLPERVSAMGIRTAVSKGGFRGYAEYAYKINDPTFANLYTYPSGNALILSTSYSQKGLSVLLQAKRSENFHFLAARNATSTALRINHLPPFTATHTYTLAAMYPYATQPLGEWAYQGEVRYTIPKKSWLGGKRGANLKIGYSLVNALDSHAPNNIDPKHNPTAMYGTDGLRSSFFGVGELYYSDLNIEIAKKISKNTHLICNYMYQVYNQEAIEGHAHNGKYVKSHIFVLDGQYKLSSQIALRSEVQYLHTRQAEGDWLFALAECSIAPGWAFSVSDQYNLGETKKHYYMVSGAYTHLGHRVMLGFGQTRAGINCSGGVCRYMPATQGVYLSYSLQF